MTFILYTKLYTPGRHVLSSRSSSGPPRRQIQVLLFFCALWDPKCSQDLVTYSMVQIPSWEANWFAASQEIPRISRNPKVHFRTNNRPPTVSILGQPNPVHIPTSHLLEIRPNIVHSPTPRSPQYTPSLRFLQQERIHPLLLTHASNAQPISFFSILSPAQWDSVTEAKAYKFSLYKLIHICLCTWVFQKVRFPIFLPPKYFT